MSMLDKIVAAVTPPESEEDRMRARMEARSAATDGDWLDQILGHHEQIENAFAIAEGATGTEARKTALARLGALLTGHSSAEEAVIYPQLSDDQADSYS